MTVALNTEGRSYGFSCEPDLFASRGFTAHEHLEDFKPINMNGRLYDPVVGRFLSPDPHVQDPTSTQSFNRYSYCLNNPLKYADPTGEKWKWKYLNPLHWMDEGMQWVNDNTTGLRQKVVEFGVPSFSVGTNIDFGGDVNFNASYMGQEVFNSEVVSIDQSVVLDAMNEARQEARSDRGGESSWLSDVWNNSAIGKIIPDVIYFNQGNTYTLVGGLGLNTGYAFVIKGKDAGHIYSTTTLIGKFGAHGSVGVNIGYSSYVGDSRNFDFDVSFGGDGTRGFDTDATVIGIGGNVSPLDNSGGFLYSYDVGFGWGVVSSINIGSSTYVYQIW